RAKDCGMKKSKAYREKKHARRKQAHEDKRRDKRKQAAQGKRTATKVERQARAFPVAVGKVNVFQSQQWRQRLQDRVIALFSDDVEEGDKAACRPCVSAATLPVTDTLTRQPPAGTAARVPQPAAPKSAPTARRPRWRCTRRATGESAGTRGSSTVVSGGRTGKRVGRND